MNYRASQQRKPFQLPSPAWAAASHKAPGTEVPSWHSESVCSAGRRDPSKHARVGVEAALKPDECPTSPDSVARRHLESACARLNRPRLDSDDFARTNSPSTNLGHPGRRALIGASSTSREPRYPSPELGSRAPPFRIDLPHTLTRCTVERAWQSNSALAVCTTA